jgi:hypothetical protein
MQRSDLPVNFPKGRTVTLTLNLFLSYALVLSLFAPFARGHNTARGSDMA